MENDQLLVTVVEDSETAAILAKEIIHNVMAKGCVLKPEALPILEKCRQKLQAAYNAAQTLENRARGEEPPRKGA